jgi:hypothetical protein
LTFLAGGGIIVWADGEEALLGQRATNDCGSRLLSRACGIVATGAATLLAVSVSGASSDAAPADRALALRLDHFQCYSVDPTSAFRPRRVSLADQLGRSRAVATRLVSLCAPVRRIRVLVRNRLAHLACYALRSPAGGGGSCLTT